MRKSLLAPAAILAGAFLCLLHAQHPGAFVPSESPVLNGKRATADIPTGQHIRNVGGSDGAGLCVFTSAEVAARWQNVPELAGFQQWMRRRPGGGWPEKLDRMVAQYARERGVPPPGYVQHTGGDEEFLTLALKTGRMPAVTYAGRDDFYRGSIAHMVNLVHLDGVDACVVDNNRPGVFVWMSRDEFLSRWRSMNGGWAFVLLAPPPPPYAEPDAEFGPVGQQCPDGRCPLVRPAAPPACPDCDKADDPHFDYQRGKAEARKLRAPVVVYVGVPARKVDGAVVVKVPSTESFAGTVGPAVFVCAWVGDTLYMADNQPLAPTVADVDRACRLIADRAPPPDPKKVGDENYGVDPSKIHKGKRYSLNGDECTRDDALRAVGGPGLSDDSGKWNLAVVGSPELHAKVKDALASAGSVADKLSVQYYAPDSWAVAQFGLPAGVTLREPDGPKVDRRGRTAGHLPPETVSAVTVGQLLDRLRPKPEPAPAPRPAPVPTPEPAPNPEPNPGPAPAPSVSPAVPLWVLVGLVSLILVLGRK